MPAKRWYWKNTADSALAPAFAAGWTAGASGRYDLRETKTNTAPTTRGIAATSADNSNFRVGQLITPVITATTWINGMTLRGMFRAWESATALNAVSQAIVRLWNVTDGTFTNLWTGTTETTAPGTEEWPGTATGNAAHRQLPATGTSIALTNSTLTAGKSYRIVVEIGFRKRAGGTSTANGNIHMGDPTGGSDITFGSTAAGNATTDSPWIEFSEDLWPVTPVSFATVVVPFDANIPNPPIVSTGAGWAWNAANGGEARGTALTYESINTANGYQLVVGQPITIQWSTMAGNGADNSVEVAAILSWNSDADRISWGKTGAGFFGAKKVAGTQTQFGAQPAYDVANMVYWQCERTDATTIVIRTAPDGVNWTTRFTATGVNHLPSTNIMALWLQFGAWGTPGTFSPAYCAVTAINPTLGATRLRTWVGDPAGRVWVGAGTRPTTTGRIMV